MSRTESFSREELITCGKGELISSLGQPIARLPLPNMLMIDRIAQISDEGGEYGKGQVLAELDINPDLWFFKCHFESDPVMPGCLGLDALWQLCGFYLSWAGNPGKGRALGAGEVKFVGQVLPTAKLVKYVIDIRRVMKKGLALVIADAKMLVDDREIYTAKNLRVGMFESTSDF